MLRYLRTIAAASTLLLCLLLYSGCGGSDQVVAHIEGTSAGISRPTLNHWMRAMAGGDFRAAIGTKAPQGLVSEPANYAECAVAAKKVIPRSFTGQASLTGAQIARKCQELHHALKAQAISYLLTVQWSIVEGEREGIKVSDALVRHEFARFRRQQYPTEADLQKYLAEHGWALSDLLYQLKRNILSTALLKKLKQRVALTGEGERAYAKLAISRFNTQAASTICDPGYVAYGCKGYHQPSIEPPAPAVVLEQFVQGH
jgi:hypothetical protein